MTERALALLPLGRAASIAANGYRSFTRPECQNSYGTRSPHLATAPRIVSHRRRRLAGLTNRRRRGGGAATQPERNQARSAAAPLTGNARLRDASRPLNLPAPSRHRRGSHKLPRRCSGRVAQPACGPTGWEGARMADRARERSGARPAARPAPAVRRPQFLPRTLLRPPCHHPLCHPRRKTAARPRSRRAAR